MKLADKIIKLRKKFGWSQEELADKMDVSRQSISKWEGAISIPDLNKIIQLSQIFGVTTDYLLKDDIEDEIFSEGDSEEGYPRIGLNEVNAYLDSKKKAVAIISKGVLLCIYSIIPLLILLSFSEDVEPIVSETIAVSIGMTILIVMVAAAVSMFISTGQFSKGFELFDNGRFELEYGVDSIIREKSEIYRLYFYRRLPLLVSSYILSVVPLIIVGALGESSQILLLTLVFLIFVVGIVTYFIIPMTSLKESYHKILCEGDYSAESRQELEKEEKLSSVYWPIVVAIFLGWSFISRDWHITWVVFPVAGLLYAALSGFFVGIRKN